MWKWIKENAVDQGMPFEQVHETFNNHYFNGAAKPEWVNEFLAARKTPFRRASDAAWTAQANRRGVQQQAKHLINDRNANSLEKATDAMIAGPRWVSVGGGIHSVVFPGTHAGALLLNPARWGAFARLMVNTWKNLSKANAEILRDNMARSANFTLAKRSRLDFSTHGTETGGGKVSARTWGALIETRFRLFDAAIQKHLDSGKYSPQEIDSIATELATWANHATGSGKGLISNTPYISKAFFGPKLAQSYWNRLIGDPVKTISTFTNWNNASAGDKVIAMHRLRGATAAILTYNGMLAANAGLLAATHQKDQINWTDPSKSDWLAFKGFGFRWGLPGAMHSELALVGHILMAPFMSRENLAMVGMRGTKGLSESGLWQMRGLYAAREGWGYLEKKATPVYGLGKELVTAHDFRGRPLTFLPWSHDKGDIKHPAMDLVEYLLSKSPIPLSAGARYFYDNLRQAGASVTDASRVMRAIMISAISGTTGVDPTEIKEDSGQHRTRYGQAQVGR